MVKLTLLQFAGVVGALKLAACSDANEIAVETVKLQHPESYLNEVIDGVTNLDRLVAKYLATKEQEGPPNSQGLLAQFRAVRTHSVGKRRLLELKESTIPIFICTGDSDNLVKPKGSQYLADVSIHAS